MLLEKGEIYSNKDALITENHDVPYSNNGFFFI